MILFLAIFLSTAPLEIPDSSTSEIQPLCHKVCEEAVYCGAGLAFGSTSLLARLGWGITLLSPWASTVGNEFLLLSDLCYAATRRAFAQMFNDSHSHSHRSWHLNQKLLSQIPASTQEEKQLLSFLKNRWLAKSTGFFSAMVDWVCPCFGVSVQVHPETTSSYARTPSIKLSQTYKNRIAAWKQSLPHPYDFPLILTRPCDLKAYLPSCLDISDLEQIPTAVEKLQKAGSKVVIDLTSLFPTDREQWMQTWNRFSVEFSQACKDRQLNPSQFICIQRIQQQEIGGIRLLPLATQSAQLHYEFLLNWVSNFGLSANRVELDRWPLSSSQEPGTIMIDSPSKDEFVSYLNSFDGTSNNPQKTLMLKGTLQVLKGLFTYLGEDRWNEIMKSSTRSAVIQLSFSKIKEELHRLTQDQGEFSFFDTASHLEQIHADLSSLIEVFAPFTSDDFPKIYRDILTSIPPNLKPLTSCGIHSSGMTSLAGIFKAVERALGKPPRVLYGENIYFESFNGAKLISNASSIQEATDEDWKNVDLILAQFNPVLKRIDLPATEYKVEKIAEILRRSLNPDRSITLALDCTLDFIDSPKVGQLLEEFQKEIKCGALNIVCYRSGLKFDLFGMDNYCGAPFFMIHNQDAKWASFDALSTDPVLQSDRLSLNWFCLAYRYAAPQLELYRNQIFENTRALLNKIPARLLHDKNVDYRVIPVERGADPAFIDVKISGPLHQIRGAALVGGCLYLKCMEGGHPIFYRPSLGFYHPNFTMLFAKEHSTIRLTLGLDPTQVDLLARCFEQIDTLNGPY